MVYRLLLNEANTTSSGSISPEQALRLRNNLSPLELASIYEQYVADSRKSGSTSETHIPRLQELLYRNSGWEAGALVRNIIRLAAGLAILGKNTRIVTSNYDVYLEEELLEYLGDMSANKSSQIPACEIRVIAPDRVLATSPASNSTSTIELVYLHGRVPRTGSIDGTLALSEADYHDIRLLVDAELDHSFTATGMLILGSGLADPPLLRALYASVPTRTNGSRVALIPSASTGMVQYAQDDFEGMIRQLGQRGRQFGLNLLIPDFHCQIAQFCQEVLTCASMGSKKADYAALRKGPPERYGQRLCAWWDRWSQKSQSPTRQQKTLKTALDSLVLNNPQWGVAGTESYKLELWVRFNPTNNRCLALWAGSSGVLLDRDALKKEDLLISTRNCSVRAFIEGKPLWLSRLDIKDIALRTTKRGWIESIEGRWDSYLAVPVRLESSTANNLQVGVITLAAKDSGRTNIPIHSVAAMESVISELQDVGGRLLTA